MKGILIVSHGKMAEGMVDSAKLFFGETVEQLDALCLKAEDSPEDFHTRVEEKIAQLDSGEGVIILADLLGGTPCNQSVALMSDKVDLIAGVNLSLLLELLGRRMSDEPFAMSELVGVGQEGLVDVKKLLMTPEAENND